jgi:iron complex outermembrane receptor protein
VNAGSARVYGVEADANYRPPSIDGLRLRASVVWLNSKYTKLTNVPCYGGQRIVDGCNLLFNPAANSGTGGFTSQDRSGVPLNRAPDFTANFGFDYQMPVGDGLSLTLASNNQYLTKQLVNLGYVFYQPAFFKADASLILRGSEDKWEIALIGKNLGNEITTGNCANGNRQGGNVTPLINGSTTRNSGGVDEVACWADRGRELWVRTSVRF